MELIDKIIYRYLAKKKYPNIAVFVNDCVGLNIIAHEVYEKKELDLILNSLNENAKENTLIDVGANIGNHSLYFSKYFKKIIAFEPQKDLFELLKINSNLKNIDIYNFGLSDKVGKSNIYYDMNNRGGGSIESKNLNLKSEQIDLQVFDQIFHDKEFSFVKIDVEGHELSVLKGMNKSIEKNKPIIAFEGKSGTTDSVISFLEKNGYSKFLVPSNYWIDNIITSHNLFLVGLRYLIRKISFKYTYRLVNLNRCLKRDYNLILAVNENSKFNLK